MKMLHSSFKCVNLSLENLQFMTFSPLGEQNIYLHCSLGENVKEKGWTRFKDKEYIVNSCTIQCIMYNIHILVKRKKIINGFDPFI